MLICIEMRFSETPTSQKEKQTALFNIIILFGSSMHIPNVVFAFAVVIYTGKRHALCVPTTNLSMLFSDKHNNNVRYTYIHFAFTQYTSSSLALLTREIIFYFITLFVNWTSVYTCSVFVFVLNL